MEQTYQLPSAPVDWEAPRFALLTGLVLTLSPTVREASERLLGVLLLGSACEVSTRGPLFVVVLALLSSSTACVPLGMVLEARAGEGVVDKAALVREAAAKEDVISSNVGWVDVEAAPANVEPSMNENSTESELSCDAVDGAGWMSWLDELERDAIVEEL